MIPHCPNDGGTSRPRRLARDGRPGGLTPNPDRTRVIPWTCRPSGASGRGSDLDRPRDLMRAPPKASVTVASQRQRVRHRLPLRGKERTCRSRPRKPAPSSEASALVRTCTVHCAAVVDRNRTRHRPRGLLDDPLRLGPVNTYLSASKMSTKWMKPMNITSSFSNRENIRR